VLRSERGSILPGCRCSRCRGGYSRSCHFLNGALPLRFSIFLNLTLAVIAASWLAESHWPATAKCSMALLVIIFQLPKLHVGYWERYRNAKRSSLRGSTGTI